MDDLAMTITFLAQKDGISDRVLMGTIPLATYYFALAPRPSSEF